MSLRALGAAALLALVATACASSAPPATTTAPDAPRAWGYRIFDTAAATEPSLDQALDSLAGFDYVLVGETHLDDQTHRLELEIYEGVLQRNGPGGATLSLEMFTRDAQPALDDYLAGSIDEAAFVEQAHPWSNYATGYRPLIEAAKQAGEPVVAANLPRALQRGFAMKGQAALQDLSAEEKTWVPAEVFAPSDTYWARVDRRLRDAGHGHPGDKDAEARRWSVQNLWDNTMADAMVAARRSRPDATVVHMVGGFHAEYRDGLAHQIRQRDPKASIAVVTVEPVSDLRGVGASATTERADYVVYALADARGIDGGQLAVTVPDELRYRINAPKVGAPDGLLIWMGDDESSDGASLAQWKAVLGESVLVAVIEPPHRVETGDLRLAGRWVWPSSATRDQSRAVAGVDNIIGYLEHRWAFPKDRVIVAGQGSGADVALWWAMYGAHDGTVVAHEPRVPKRLAEASVPEKRASRSVRVVATLPEAAAKTLALAGLDLQAATGSAQGQVARALRRPFSEPPSDAPWTVAVDSPIALQWAQLHAAISTASGSPASASFSSAATPSLVALPQHFADGRAVPTAPGAFGGATIFVVPTGASDQDLAAWRKLGDPDVLHQRNRFARLQVVTRDELGPALSALHEAGKSNVLVTPAAFVASAAEMSELEALTRGHTEGLSLNWLPGLGGAMAQAGVVARPSPSE